MLSELFGGPYGWLIKYGSILAILVGMCGFSYYEGVKHEKVVYQSKIVEKVVTQTKYVTSIEQPKEAQQQAKVKIVHDQATSFVLQYVPSDSSCDLGPDAIRLLNSLRGTLSPQP